MSEPVHKAEMGVPLPDDVKAQLADNALKLLRASGFDFDDAKVVVKVIDGERAAANDKYWIVKAWCDRDDFEAGNDPNLSIAGGPEEDKDVDIDDDGFLSGYR